jgi:peptidoglycan hydrolase CwlO-like protein
MFLEWMFVTAFIVFVLFMSIRMFYYRSVAHKEEKNSAVMKLTLQEAEILIRKYQLQLQRALGNIDILTEELNTLRNEIKAVKQRNSQYRIESEKHKARIKDLEQKIEALL